MAKTLLQKFQSELTALPSEEIIRKYITTGMPVHLSEDDYFNLRKVIAHEFKLHPSSVVLIGSCRLGFSIAPKKRYRLARPDSDLDVAIVSAEQFDVYWDAVFSYSVANRGWTYGKSYDRFLKMLFSGWIDPRGLPNVARFKEAADWANFFDGLMQSRKFGPRRITARLYRNWSRLEAYQDVAVRKCLANIGDIKSA